MTSRETQANDNKFKEWPLTAVPTPVPLEAREWLTREANDPKSKIGCRWLKLRIEQGGALEYLAVLLESYSSHVNAALMEKLGTEQAYMPTRAEVAEATKAGNKKVLMQADLAVLTHRALVHTVLEWHDAFYKEENRANREKSLKVAAESRISELERERDEARELVDGLRIMYEAEARVHNRTYELWTTAESQLSTTQEALRKYQESIVDGKITPDQFWDDADTERNYRDPEELLHESYGYGDIAKIQCAIDMPPIYGFMLKPSADAEDDDATFHFFKTREEAERVLSPPTKLP